MSRGYPIAADHEALDEALGREYANNHEEVTELPGVMAYGPSRAEAAARAQALALRGIADRLDHGEEVPGWMTSSR